LLYLQQIVFSSRQRDELSVELYVAGIMPGQERLKGSNKP